MSTHMPRARTVPTLLEEMAERYADREAVVDGSMRYRYAALRDEVRRTASALMALGVQRGDKVGVLMGNRIEWIVATLAACSIGAVTVAINTWLTSRELQYVLAHSDARVLLTSGRYLKYDYLAMLDELGPLCEQVPMLREIVVLDEFHREPFRRWSELKVLASTIDTVTLQARLDETSAADIALLLYTSGSTSLPKGVQLQHFGLIEYPFRIGENQRVTERDRLWLGLSLFWALGCVNALFNVLTHGACVVLQDTFNAGVAIELIERERCSMFYGFGNMIQAIYDHPSRMQHDLTSLRGGGAAGAPEQIARIVELGAREICNGYGMTELYGTPNINRADDPLDLRLRSVGGLIPGWEQRIVDPLSGNVLASGEVGEIRIRGHATCGYYKDPVKTAEAFDADGFFKTGDLGSLDEAGNLFFRGRLKEMVKTGGINVNPLEVEAVLMSHPSVELALCFGVPDAKRDEILAVIVVARSGAMIDEAAIRALCVRSLASYKVPRLIRFASATQIPTTSTGKFKKNELAATFFPAET